MSENKRRKVFYADFGCRLNQFETRVLKNSKDLNLITTQNQKDADFIVINTCTVTNRADVKNRQAIRKARLANPDAHIIVTGCYASTDSDSLKKMDEVNTVITNAKKFTIPDFILGKQTDETINLFPLSNQSLNQNARAYLKIQDGCNKLCTYCKIPMSRGKAVSRDMDDTVLEVQNLIKSGFQEIILTGINIGHYKTNQGKLNDILKRLAEIHGNHFYRISSIEPDCINDEFLNIISAEKFAKFLHIPVQSGSNHILKSMRRGYSAEKYFESVYLIKNKIPGIHIGTDVIVGFPGETDDDFKQTFNLVKKLEFSNVHIFPFSKRTGSEIDKILSKQLSSITTNSVFEINGEIIRNRVQQLIALQEKNKIIYIHNTSNRPYRAIIEKIIDNTVYFVTENYFKGNIVTTNQFQKGDQIQVLYDNDLKFSLVN
ncbi:MAG: tRNA (N(6)-L-threonylcarbamoyladenosine(37)-C(2))-methylthiotransferase MtaB [Spirochaetia bacterium]|nr:tRNA (N(6)-L-threonylcarbamoyladenosine(37)-C(2))-methylthiotransferase MtaB [Spirochaetia bacterium]